MSNNFNMSFDPTLRKQFADVVSEYGLTVPQAFKLFATQVVATRKVPLSFDYKANPPNAKTILAMQELDGGGGTLYANLDDLLAECGNATNQDK